MATPYAYKNKTNSTALHIEEEFYCCFIFGNFFIPQNCTLIVKFKHDYLINKCIILQTEDCTIGGSFQSESDLNIHVQRFAMFKDVLNVLSAQSGNINQGICTHNGTPNGNVTLTFDRYDVHNVPRIIIYSNVFTSRKFIYCFLWYLYLFCVLMDIIIVFHGLFRTAPLVVFGGN